ncbi:DUF1428 domain-containing protein [Hyphobacterium indicum]|uniref:DUF1428 domain-containing protein n=1 Tax=Hyphobacterium indicum TaxID=2162714 RepID=UPI000D6565B9|nr:DUF1428 domain-containing protein [Hyphobacterium indicum]
MSYVDGFVVAVPSAKKTEYLEMAKLGATVFKDHGALSVVEAWGDDVPDGKVTSFPMAVKATADETVVFSWIVWPDRAARDAGMAAAMKDERFAAMGPDAMPFDGKRMIFGGFEMIVEA